MKRVQEDGQRATDVRHDQVDVRRHGTDGVHLDARAARKDREEVEQDLGHDAVGAQEHVAEDGAPGDEVGGPGEDLSGLAHGGG